MTGSATARPLERVAPAMGLGVALRGPAACRFGAARIQRRGTAEVACARRGDVSLRRARAADGIHRDARRPGAEGAQPRGPG